MKSEEILARLVRAVNIGARPFTTGVERQYGLPLNEWRCLRRLSANPDMDSAKWLADQTGLDKMSTSRALKGLERKQLISRKRSNDDRRRYCIGVTAKGHKLVETILPAALARADLMLRPLSAAQKKALVEALDLVIEHTRNTD